MEDLLLLIISSPSGAGKTTLTRELLRTFPDFTFSVSHTTRKARQTEVDGKDYHFVSRDDFQKQVDQDAFLEWAEVHGNFYGTGRSELDRARKQGKRGIFFDIDYQGARQIKAVMPQACGVFILPPSMEELERRLRGRASEDEQSIEKRFKKARLEIEHYGLFDYLVVNDDLEQAGARLRSVIYSELSTRKRMATHAEDLLRYGRLEPKS
ncbi:MAG: guanylate kinase [Myxococcales bacterium]|nr:MAG: guanylate kinase [Myxococcales bacterium]